MRERIKVLCDWRFDNEGELASDVAEKVNRGRVVLDYVEIVKRFLFLSRKQWHVFKNMDTMACI